ncbi:hypothetical protein NEF87_002933 [Candidatus Lokiarchaeum ossiferum]|uniref:Uncharacterized protein n=1 Tax=Candidatus Lokiarchaeum ossiferum TaxID=2951803 RepID=A0ABY6HT11_9ARCH|nr:hypothetical protein NEF87_002933 [Candidatus Lokiarchaeum sp. B-35]
MTTKIKENIHQRRERRRNTRKILKYQVFGSFPKTFGFLIWIFTIVSTPFIESTSPIGVTFEIGLYFFFLTSITTFLIGPKWDNILGLLVNLILSFLLFWFGGIFGIIVIVGYGYLIGHELLTFQEAAPIIKSLNQRLRTYKIKKPGIIFIILLILFTLGQQYLSIFVFYDINEDLDTAIVFWELADFLATATIIIFYLIFRKRKDPLHHNLKAMLLWVFIVVKIMAIPLAYNLYKALTSQEEIEIANFNIFNLVRFIILTLLVLWDFGKTIVEESYDEKDRKYDSMFNGLYGISLFNNYIETYGFGELNDMFVIILIGFGVFLLVRKLAKDSAKVQQVPNYRFLRKSHQLLDDLDEIGKKVFEN